MTEPQRRRATPARLSKGERKRQLLAHARQLFFTLGYQSTTLEKIAAAAGVSEVVLARHFRSLPEVFQEVLKEAREATVLRWESETAELTDPLAKLHALIDRYLESTREHALLLRTLHRTLVETEDEEVLGLMRTFYLECEALLARIIAEGQQSGVFRRSLDPRIGAWQLIRAALGYTLTLPLAVPLHEEGDHLPQAIDCLLHGLLKTDV